MPCLHLQLQPQDPKLQSPEMGLPHYKSSVFCNRKTLPPPSIPSFPSPQSLGLRMGGSGWGDSHHQNKEKISKLLRPYYVPATRLRALHTITSTTRWGRHYYPHSLPWPSYIPCNNHACSHLRAFALPVPPAYFALPLSFTGRPLLFIQFSPSCHAVQEALHDYSI